MGKVAKKRGIRVESGFKLRLQESELRRGGEVLRANLLKIYLKKQKGSCDGTAESARAKTHELAA